MGAAVLAATGLMLMVQVVILARLWTLEDLIGNLAQRLTRLEVTSDVVPRRN